MGNEIMDYVMQSPENTNPNVLRGLLENNGGSLPSIMEEDKDKYLHTNESTGALEWSQIQSGGAFSVTITIGENSSVTADKTPQEIAAAAANGEVIVATCYIPAQDSRCRVYLGEYFVDEGPNSSVSFYNLNNLDHPINGNSKGWVWL